MPKRRSKVKLSKTQVLENDLHRWEAKMEASISTLVKATGMIKRLERQLRAARKRNTQMLVAHTEELLRSNVSVGYIPPPVEETQAGEAVPDEDIPGFLQRQRDRSRDAEAAGAVRAEQEAERQRKTERSRERSKVKSEVKMAELTGKRRKMPLSGKAALDAIRGS